MGKNITSYLPKMANYIAYINLVVLNVFEIYCIEFKHFKCKVHCHTTNDKESGM